MTTYTRVTSALILKRTTNLSECTCFSSSLQIQMSKRSVIVQATEFNGIHAQKPGSWAHNQQSIQFLQSDYHKQIDNDLAHRNMVFDLSQDKKTGGIDQLENGQNCSHFTLLQSSEINHWFFPISQLPRRCYIEAARIFWEQIGLIETSNLQGYFFKVNARKGLRFLAIF